MSETVKQEGDFKIKKKPGRPRKLNKKDETIKVDLSKKEEEKKEENAVQEQTTDEVLVRNESPISEEVSKEDVKEATEEPTEEKKVEEVISPIQEITEEEVKEEEKVEEPVAETKQQEVNLPENIEKLVKFMEETGGTVEDYVRLNADYSNVDDNTLLKEYYKRTKPHLNIDEINFIMEDNFSFDEDVDEERDIRKKKLAFKEEIAKAKNFLEDTKSKYYDEIKLRPGVTQEQQKAMDFFNRYNKQQEQAEQQHQLFKDNTKKLFSDDFKGFDISVGEKKYKYNIQNIDKVAENQSNITNLVGKFLDENGNVKDVNGYHKAIYAAENVDKIAAHFYEQGKADAVKDVVNKSKNLSDTKARTSQGDVFIGGMKVRAISGSDSTKLKIKTKKFN
mgnify:CR=1 FL=1